MSEIFQISIQDNDLNKVTLRVSKDMTIKEVKELYYKKIGKNYNSNFMLFYNVKKLDDEKTVGFYKVKKNGILKYLSIEQNIIAAK